MQNKEKALWVLFGTLAVGVGLYPTAFLNLNFGKGGLLSSKSRSLLDNEAYLISFYLHIALGGLALLTGWSQFIKSWRNKYLSFHRFLGYVYVTSVFLSSITGFIIALFSTGGTVAEFGFGALAVAWFISNLLAFINIKNGLIKEHEKWMIRNYALTFAAVTLRIYLPISMIITKGNIVFTLKLVSWLCWVPNVIVMEIYIQSQYERLLSTKYLTQTEAKSHSDYLEWKNSEMHAFKRAKA